MIVLRIVLVLLALCSSVQAGNVAMLGGGTASAPPTYLLEETFDSTGYDLGVCGTAPCWTEILNEGIVNEDYATSPAPLDGTYSLLLDENGTGQPIAKLVLADPLPNAYIKFRMYGTKVSSGNAAIVKLYGTTTTQCDTLIASFSVDGSERWVIDSNLSNVSGLWVSATTFNGYLWLEYEKGQASNGIGRLYASDTNTKPALPEVTKSTISVALDVECIYFSVTDATATLNIFDNICVDNDIIN